MEIEKVLKGVWRSMIYRCSQNVCKDPFTDYGARGISVCESWKNDFWLFYQWAIEHNYEIGLQIDRIDNDGNYEPNNCRFVSKKINSRNKRNTFYVEFEEKKIPLAELAERYNIKYSVVYSRIKNGWNIKDALTKNVRFKITKK